MTEVSTQDVRAWKKELAEKGIEDRFQKKRPLKILIMVLSYNKPPFDELMKAQQDTWASVNEDNVDTMFYYGGLDFKNMFDGPRPKENLEWAVSSKNGFNDNLVYELFMRCTDQYYYMGAKMKKALEYLSLYHTGYDLIFRTNSSSYVNKKRLVEFAKTLPKEKIYAGWTFLDSEDFGGLCVSGAGIFLSRDTADILRNEIDPTKEIEEDVYIGRILRKHGIVAIDDKSRYDVNVVLPYGIPKNLYHYRFKTGDRIQDANNMRAFHKLLT